VADYKCVLLLDVELNVDRVLLHPVDDDDPERFSRPLRLTYSADRLLVACRSQFVNIYRWRPSFTSVTDSPTVSET